MDKAQTKINTPKISSVSVTQAIQSVPSEEKESASKPAIVVPSKPTSPNTSMSAAAYISLTASRYNAQKVKLDTTNVVTQTLLDKAALERAKKGTELGGYTPANIIRNAERETKATFYESLAKYKNKAVPTSSYNLKSVASAGGKEAIARTQSAFSNKDDLGDQTVGGAVGAATMAYTAIKLSNKISPAVFEAAKNLPSKVVKVGKGAYQVADAVGKTYITLKNSTRALHSGFRPFASSLKSNAVLSGLSKTTIAKRITRIKGSVASAVTKVKTVSNNIKNTAKYSFAIVKGVAGGTVSIKTATQLAKPLLLKAKVAGLKTLSSSAQSAGKGIAKSSVWVAKRGVPNAVKGVKNVSFGAVNMLSNSDDMMLRGVGNVATATRYTVKTGIGASKFAVKTVKTSAKGATKATKSIYNGIKLARQRGLKAAWAKAKSTAKNALLNGGKSVVSAIVNLVRGLGAKLIVPLACVGLVVSLFMGAAGGAGATAGYFLSGEFLFKDDDVYTVTDVNKFLNNEEYGVPDERGDKVGSIFRQTQGSLKVNQPSEDDPFNADPLGLNTYDCDRVEYRIIIDDEFHNITERETAKNIIDSTFYTKEQLINAVRPIFYAGLLVEYDLEPSEEEAIELFDDIFVAMFDYDKEVRVETCAMPVHSCGETHCAEDCPAPTELIHSEYTCDSCCYYSCGGHPEEYCLKKKINQNHICNDTCVLQTIIHIHLAGEEAECDNMTFHCSGMQICGGHRIAMYTYNLEDIELFLEEYFEEPIRELEEDDNRTEEENAYLSRLKDYYVICLEWLKENSD